MISQDILTEMATPIKCHAEGFEYHVLLIGMALTVLIVVAGA